MTTAILEHEKTETIEEKQHSLTSNGFTAAEEVEILRIVERMRKGEEKIYSPEEASRYLGLDD